MIPKQLLDTLTSLEFEEDGGIVIKSTEYNYEDLSITVAITTGKDEAPQNWKITCLGMQIDQMSHGWASDLSILDTHPLLWPHGDQESELYILGPAETPVAIYGDIVMTHNANCNGWFHPNRFLNKSISPIELLSSSGGLLARGPHTLLSAYASVLTTYSVKHQLLSHAVSAPDAVTSVHLLIIGDNYVIAREFLFELI